MNILKVSLSFLLLASSHLLASSGINFNSAGNPNFYVFGDSLSDAGTYQQTTQAIIPQSGRFTINPGKTTAQDIAASYGLPSDPNASGLSYLTQTILGGTNYAQGGARVAIPYTFSIFTPKPVTLQVAQFFSDTQRTINPNSFAFVWAGANDVLTQFATNWATSQAAALEGVTTAANTLVSLVQEIKNANIRNIIVVKVPDLGITPFGLSTNPAAFTQLTQTFNTALSTGIAPLNVITIDPTRVLTQILADPVRFGFYNINQSTDFALNHAAPPPPLPSSILLVEGINIVGGNNYVFADDVHPSAAAHQILADTIVSVVRAPCQLVNMATAPLFTMRQQLENLETKLDNIRLNEESILNSECNRFTVFSNYTYEKTKQHNFFDNHTQSNAGTIGVDFRVHRNWLVGLEGLFVAGHTHFAHEAGSFKDTIYNGLAYTVVNLPHNFTLNAYGDFGRLSIFDWERNAYLGQHCIPVHACGKTSGSYYAGKVALGYAWMTRCLDHYLSLGVGSENVKLNCLREGGDFIALNVNKLKFNVVRLSLGWDISYTNPECFSPYARISLEHDLKKNPLCVRYGMDPALLTTVRLKRPGRTYANINTGFNYAARDNVMVTFNGNVHAGQKHMSSWSLNTGLTLTF